MSQGHLERIFEALEANQVRYLVVGGVAVVLHGHLRFTADLDLVVDLEANNTRKVVATLQGLGFRPQPHVDMTGFADESVRQTWVREKQLVVFSLWNPTLPGTVVDLFVEAPFDFDEAQKRAVVADLGGVPVRVVSRRDLIAMKRAAGRPQDFDDVAVLESLGPEEDRS